MTDYLGKIKKVISEKIGIEPSEINAESFIEDDLNIGEMDLLEILEELEEIFQIELIEHSKSFETIQDIIDVWKKKFSKKLN
jgi:acyl carrier protein